MNNECEICYKPNANEILSCGCLLCSECYLQTKFYINNNDVKCISCEKEILLTETIHLNNKNIIGQIHKYNSEENNEKILSKLKVNNYYLK